MKRGFPQKIEPLLPQSLGKEALDALMELATATSEGKSPSVDVLNQIRCLRTEDIESVVRQAGGADWVNRYLVPLLTSADCQRRLQTSAAVMGLALSMGASDILSLMRNQALAAEASAAEMTESQRVDELAAELQKLAESAAVAVEHGGFERASSDQFSPAVVSVNLPTNELRSGASEAGGLNISGSSPALEGDASSYHIVQPGETVFGLARSYGVSPAQIVSLNRLESGTAIQAGQTLKVPDGAVQASSEPNAAISAGAGEQVLLSQLKPYQVQPGDTLASIARSYEVSREDLVALNQLDNPNALEVNQVIALPRGARLSSRGALGSSHVASAMAEPLEQKSEGISSQSSLPAPPETVSAVTAVPSAPQSRTATPLSRQTATYRVQTGDTLAKISRKTGSSMAELSRMNGISNPNYIFVGQTLKVPTTANDSQLSPRQSLDSSAVVAEASPSEVKRDSSAYVSNLMDEIRQMRRKIRGDSQVAEDLKKPLVPDITRDEEPSSSKTASESRPAVRSRNPARYLEGLKAELQELQSRDRQTAQESSGETGQINVELPPIASEKQKQPQVVAAAPLGSQSYEPLAQSLLSRSVSPELPPLLSEPFMPDGSVNGYVWPAKGTFTSGFGWRWGRMHKGIDIAGPVGTPIVAAAAGVVTYSGWNDGGYGNLVEITHSDGSVSIYAHNSRLNVRKGQRVRQGQQIAEMGSTGYSTGPHLHFEIRVPGQGAVNPVSLLGKE